MSAWGSARGLGDVWVAPDDAFERLRAQPSLGVPFVVVGVAATALLVVQSFLLEPALRFDPLFVDLPAPAHDPVRWLRLVLALVAPLGILLRALAFGSLLHALTLVAGGSCRWQHAVALVLHLEVVFLLETAGIVLLLAIERPGSWEAVRAVHLRAGLDLLWQPSTPALAAVCTAANAFTLWWGLLLTRGVSRLATLPRRTAAVLVLPLWLTTVALRFLLQSR